MKQAHNDLPLAVEKLLITEETLSSYQKEILNKFPEISMSKLAKLVPSFLPKRKYMSLNNLQFYLKKDWYSKKFTGFLEVGKRKYSFRT